MESYNQKEINRRRTFGIISHPDAGKTTLTEKLLLFGGAINMAGAVKAKKAARHATSDWMKMEQERGISVTSSVMQFRYRERIVNLLDTPGHADFSELTLYTTFEPCPMCCGAILASGVHTLVMGARHNLAQSRWGAYTVERLLDLTNRAGQLIVITGVLTQACADVRMLETK